MACQFQHREPALGSSLDHARLTRLLMACSPIPLAHRITETLNDRLKRYIT